MVINIADYLNHCFTNDDGQKILEVIKPLIDSRQSVELSFKGIDSVSSSFVNSAFIELLQYYDFEYIKEKLNFRNTNRMINSIIKKRFDFETQRRIGLG